MVAGILGANRRVVSIAASLQRTASVCILPHAIDKRRLGVYSGVTSNPVRLTQKVYDGIFAPFAIPIPDDLVDGHFLQHYLTRKEPISDSLELSNILGLMHGIKLEYYENGGIPASPNEASSYSRRSWRRDNAIVILAMIKAGLHTQKSELLDFARNEIIQSALFDNDAYQRGKYTAFFWNGNPKAKYRDDVNGNPRAMYSISADGRLGEYFDWGHDQLDSIGLDLYVKFYAANRGVIDLKELDQILSEQNPENQADSILSVALKFLDLIEYYDQVDKGPWEKQLGYKRASSIAICLAAFKEAEKYFESRSWDPSRTIKVNESVDLKSIIKQAIQRGEGALAVRIPKDGRDAVETSEILDDAALAFTLLFTETPLLDEYQQRAVLKTLRRLMREHGFVRMQDHIDTFMGENYINNPHGGGQWSDPSIPNHHAARWTFVDPILAAYFYANHIELDGTDEETFLLADYFFKRSCSQITSEETAFEQYVNPYEKIQVTVPNGVLPEARSRMHIGGKAIWLPNNNSPLQMAQALLAISFVEADKAIKLRESLGHPRFPYRRAS